MPALKSLLISALAATASATLFDSEALRREVLHIRADSTTSQISKSMSISVATPYPTATPSTNSSNACSTVLAGLATLITGLPTPTGDLYSYLQTAATTLTDPCHLTVPTSIAAAFSIYESSVISFYSAHSSQLNSALAACPSLTSLVANPVCSTSGSQTIVKTIPPSTPTATATVAKTGTATGTATGNGAGAGTSTPSPSVVSSSGMRGEVGGVMLVLGALGALAGFL